MALVKPRRRFILVQSTSNDNVNEDNMEPYHISVFRRSTSMPPLPQVRSKERKPSTVNDRNENQTKKKRNLFKFEAMKRKSARLTIRLSNVFGFSSQTVDERFNFEEQRFRSMEKFLQVFLRETNLSIEALRVKKIGKRKFRFCRRNFFFFSKLF